MEFTDTTPSALRDVFLTTWNNTHIGVIDYIISLQEFARIVFNLNYDNLETFIEEHFQNSKQNCIKQKPRKGYSRFNDSLRGIDMYDFIKHKVAPISSNSHRKRDTFSKEECLNMILDRVAKNGYSDDLLNPINAQFQEDRSYRYNSKTKYYAEKHIWQAYRKFLGYLFLQGKLKSEDDNRYRLMEIQFDPAFPRLPPRTQIVANCFFPSREQDVQQWIDSENENFIDEFYVHKLFSDEDWGLLSASISQNGKENDSKFYLSASSFLIPTSRIHGFRNGTYNGDYHHEGRNFYNIYAGESSWSKFCKPSDAAYDEKRYKITEVVFEYRWAGWSNNRHEDPNFPFLNTSVANSIDLRFNLPDLALYSDKIEQVTKIIWTV